MRHKKKTIKLNRHGAHRRALIANLTRGLFLNEAITTTLAKAKAAKPFAEKMITLGKKDDVNSRRQVASMLHDKKIIKKLFSEIAPKFADRVGGYTRIARSGFRAGDGAQMAILELVGRVVKPKAGTVEEKGKVKEKGKSKTETKSVAKETEAKK